LLRLDGEQKRGGEVVHHLDARVPARLTKVLDVSVRETDEPPDQSEDNPAEREREYEYQQIPSPFYVDERREDVGKVVLPAVVDVRAGDVAVAVLVDETVLWRSWQ